MDAIGEDSDSLTHLTDEDSDAYEDRRKSRSKHHHQPPPGAPPSLQVAAPHASVNFRSGGDSIVGGSGAGLQLSTIAKPHRRSDGPLPPVVPSDAVVMSSDPWRDHSIDTPRPPASSSRKFKFDVTTTTTAAGKQQSPVVRRRTRRLSAVVKAPPRAIVDQGRPIPKAPGYGGYCGCRKGLAVTTMERNELYREQMAEHPPSQATVTDIAELHMVKKMLSWRRVTEDVSFFLSIAGIYLMILTNDYIEADRVVMEDSAAGCEKQGNKCNVLDNDTTFYLKCAVSALTLLLCISVTVRFMVQMKLKMLKEIYSKSTLCFLQRPPEFFRWIAQIAICAFHIPPGVDFLIVSPPIKGGQVRANSTPPYIVSLLPPSSIRLNYSRVPLT